MKLDEAKRLGSTLQSNRGEEESAGCIRVSGMICDRRIAVKVKRKV